MKLNTTLMTLSGQLTLNHLHRIITANAEELKPFFMVAAIQLKQFLTIQITPISEETICIK